MLLHGGSQNAHTWDTVALALRPTPLVADRPARPRPLRRRPANGNGLTGHRGARPATSPWPSGRWPRRPAGVVGMSLRRAHHDRADADGARPRAQDRAGRRAARRSTPSKARHIVDFVNGPPTFPSFDDLLARTIEFNPTRSVSSLRRGILHNAVQLDDGSWVWRHSRRRLDDGEPAQAMPASRGGGALFDDLLDTLGRIHGPGAARPWHAARLGVARRRRGRAPAAAPTAEVVHFEEAGHSIQGDMPVELAATIRAFIL